jgi:hypothetical protein
VKSAVLGLLNSISTIPSAAEEAEELVTVEDITPVEDDNNGG